LGRADGGDGRGELSRILKDRAIILRTRDYGETSLIVTAITSSEGRSDFLAKGVKRPGSAMHGRFMTGNMGDIVYYDKPGSSLKLIKEFSASPVLDSSSAGLERLCIFQAGLEIAGRASTGDEEGGIIFSLIEAFISVLSSGFDPWGALFVLELRLLDASGLMPSIARCDGCNKDLAGCSFKINPSNGAVECEGCGEGESSLSSRSCGLLERMLSGGFDEVRGLELDAELRREIGTLLHRILMHHMAGYRLPGSLGMLKGVG
jgi:DNA repair protein RecO (recombination protein O)